MRGETGSEQGKVISFLGSKGGLGTTTTLVSIGAALSIAGKRVIVAELRPELGHLQTLLGLASGDGTQGLFALAPQAISAKSVSGWIVNHNSGLQVLPAPTGIRPDLVITTEQAQAIVAALSLSAEITLLDLPPFPAIESETALRLSDRVPPDDGAHATGPGIGGGHGRLRQGSRAPCGRVARLDHQSCAAHHTDCGSPDRGEARLEGVGGHPASPRRGRPRGDARQPGGARGARLLTFPSFQGVGSGNRLDRWRVRIATDEATILRVAAATGMPLA